MTRSEVIKKLEKLQAKEKTVAAEIELLRETCEHPAVVKTYRADTGNYDSRDNQYWTEYTCPDCGKFWSANGSK